MVWRHQLVKYFFLNSVMTGRRHFRSIWKFANQCYLRKLKLVFRWIYFVDHAYSFTVPNPITMENALMSIPISIMFKVRSSLLLTVTQGCKQSTKQNNESSPYGKYRRTLWQSQRETIQQYHQKLAPCVVSKGKWGQSEAHDTCIEHTTAREKGHLRMKQYPTVKKNLGYSLIAMLG